MTYSIVGLPVKYTPGTRIALCRRIVILLLLLLIPSISPAQTADDEPVDEISVSLEVRNVGIVDIPAVYHNNDIYLSITNVLDFLKVRNTPNSSFDSVRGYFLNEQDVFLIDKVNGRIYYQGKVMDVKTDGLIKTETSLFLNLKYIKSVFGFDGSFYFRRLVVTLSSEVELPVVREIRLEQMRRNVNRLRGDIKADTVIQRKYPLFHFGMADWAVMSSQQSQGPDQTTLNLGLGGIVAGGETNASLNYYSNQPFTEKLQFYQWRFVNNDNPFLRQSIAGKIFTQATSTLYAPVVGIQFNNTPTTYRKSYGTYTLSNTTEPNWIVELYVNDVLVDYKKADAAGFYSFDVPLIYGYTVVKLRFYGPYGEERTSQQYINIPFNFLPKHEFEYSASAGIVEDNMNSQFSRLRMNYGLSHKITIGGGVEYLSSVTSGSTMPFLNTSVRLGPRMLVSGEYTHGVRSRGLFSYRLPSSIQFELDYTKYDKGQTAIYFNYLEERKAVISLPIRAKGLSLFSRLTLDQIVVPNSSYMNTEWAFTGFVGRVGLNFSTYTSFVQESLPYLYSIGSIALPLPAKTIFTSQMQYDYKMGKPVFLKFSFQKYLFGKGYLELAYQEYFYVNNRNILLGLRYDFSFSRVAFSALTGNNKTYSRVEAASGSLIFDSKTKYVNANNRTNVGKGAVCIQPYLDLNNNHKKDPGESKAPGLKIRINGGRIIYDDKDTCIRILDLEPYASYYIELNRNAFDNISWQIKNKTISVAPNPNTFTVIEVPVIVAGEVSGVVSLKGRNAELPKGLGQIIVNIYDEDSIYVARTISESDGYFSYLGLTPGLYFARVDTAQLRKLHFIASPLSLPVNITGNKDGDVVDGLEFVLQSTLRDTTATEETVTQTTAKKETTDTSKHTTTGKPVVNQKPVTTGKPVVSKPAPAKKEITEEKKENFEEVVIGEKGSYAILVEVYGEIAQASVLKGKIVRAFKLPVSIVQDGEDFKVEIMGFPSRDAARRHLPRLKEWGFPEALIIRLKEKVFK